VAITLAITVLLYFTKGKRKNKRIIKKTKLMNIFTCLFEDKGSIGILAKNPQ